MAEPAKHEPKMEASTTGAGDPSMEEILQSIRRIIAEDEPGAAPKDLSSDVLELTEMVQEDGSVVALETVQEPAAPPRAAAQSPKDVLASIDSALESAAPAIPAEPPAAAQIAPAPAIPASAAPVAPAPASTPPEAPKPAASAADSLLSDVAAAASASAFRKLAQTREKPAAPSAPSPAFRSGSTLEDLMLELLRPMLKDWLDMNLQPIVERIVEREVKRLSGQ